MSKIPNGLPCKPDQIIFVEIDHGMISTVRWFKKGICQLLAKVYPVEEKVNWW